MNIECLVLGPLDTNCYIVSDATGAGVIVIDPAGEAEVLLAALGDRQVSIVVLTHCHFDHLGAASALLAQHDVPLAVHDSDADFITDSVGTGGAAWGFDAVAPPATRRLVDGDVVQAGSLVLRVIATPGHTPGSICIEVDGHLFSGDTLFAGSVGRTDFPRGDARMLARSVRDRLSGLEDAMVVHPGHGPDTTIGRERTMNPFFPRG